MRVRPQAAGQKHDPGLQKVIGRGQKKIVYTWSYIMDYLGRDILSVTPAVYILLGYVAFSRPPGAFNKFSPRPQTKISSTTTS